MLITAQSQNLKTDLRLTPCHFLNGHDYVLRTIKFQVSIMIAGGWNKNEARSFSFHCVNQILSYKFCTQRGSSYTQKLATCASMVQNAHHLTDQTQLFLHY